MINVDSEIALKQPRTSRNSSSTKTTRANVEEEGDLLEYEVEGQATEFIEEFEEGEREESSSESESEEEISEDEDGPDKNPIQRVSTNNNATITSVGKQKITEPSETEEIEMEKFVNYMKKKGLMVVEMSTPEMPEMSDGKRSANIIEKTGQYANVTQAADSNSVVTVYRGAVKKSVKSKRDSSSLENPLDTSDEIEQMNQVEMGQLSIIDRNDNNYHIACDKRSFSQGAALPGTSRDITVTPRPREELSKAEGFIQSAEASKARIYDVPGKQTFLNMSNLGRVQNVQNAQLCTPQNFSSYHPSFLDEDYLLIGSHVDDITRRKIGNGEYVDFTKLIPKDRISNEDDHRMEIVNRGGMSFFVPASDREAVNISNFAKWE